MVQDFVFVMLLYHWQFTGRDDSANVESMINFYFSDTFMSWQRQGVALDVVLSQWQGCCDAENSEDCVQCGRQKKSICFKVANVTVKRSRSDGHWNLSVCGDASTL